MSAYRFCRTDDIPLLVRAYNECVLPHRPEAQAYAVAELKRDIRELALWCSSCMVAFEGDRPVGVVLGCKRPPETYVLALGVHPEHVRRGHGRHLLTSLSAKLAILGPPRLLAEVPAGDAAARGLFESCGWREEGRYRDLVLDAGRASPAPPGVVQPVTLGDLGDGILPAEGKARAWERTRETLVARRERLRGLAIVSEERIEASLLYTRDAASAVSVWGMTAPDNDRGSVALAALVRDLAHRESCPIRVPRLAADELPPGRAEAIGFRAVAETIALACSATPA